MSQLISTRLESLSNEILLEIFEYLDAFTLCSIFYRTNQRLSDLLRLCHLHAQFDRHTRDKRVWDTLATFINPRQIYALSFYNVAIHERFLPSITENLVSLYFYRVNPFLTNLILEHIPVVNRIKTLCFSSKTSYEPAEDSFYVVVFLKHGHRLTSLVNCLCLSENMRRIHTFPIVTAMFSQLRRLSLNYHGWTPNLVQFLRENTPNLRSLYFHRDFRSDHELIPAVIKHIRELDINIVFDLTDLECILSTLPCLKRLRILWNNNQWTNIIDGSQWQEIIEKYLPLLEHFTLDFESGIDDNIADTFYTEGFWSTKNVVIKLAVNKIQCRFRQIKTIYFGQQWRFEYFDGCKTKVPGDFRNPSSPSRSRSRSSSTPLSWQFARELSPLHSRSGSPSSVRSQIRSGSPTRQRSRSRSRMRQRSSLSSRSRQRFLQRTRVRSPSRTPSRSRPRHRLPFRRDLRSRSRSGSRHRLPFRRDLRSRSRSGSRHRLPFRRDLRSQSRSGSRTRSRRQLQPQSRSRSRGSRRQLRPQSGSRTRLRRQLISRTRSRTQSRRQVRPQSRPRSRPRQQLRSRR